MCRLARSLYFATILAQRNAEFARRTENSSLATYQTAASPRYRAFEKGWALGEDESVRMMRLLMRCCHDTLSHHARLSATP
jgi:hypothetical protein